jgi:glycine reductase
MKKIRVVHYINQFFAQIGAEDKAHVPPEIKKGALGPGILLQQLLGNNAEVVATVFCGDNYYAEKSEVASREIVTMVAKYQPDILIAGPAFNAGRYGIACSGVCHAVANKLSIPVITGMFKENPGIEIGRGLYIIETANSAAKMKDALTMIVRLALKLVNNEEIGAPEEEGYFPRGIRENYFAEKIGAVRAVDMLLLKLAGEPYKTEYPIPSFDRVPPSPPVIGLKNQKIAIVTSGGIVPKGNPDRIESSSASKFGEYSLAGLDKLTAASHETAHGGYDPVYANQDPNRVLPVDVLRQLEREGVIGKLHELYYATVGNGTSVANAKKFGAEIATRLKKAAVSAVILTST